MNSFKIIIAAVMIMMASNILTACSASTGNTPEVAMQRIEEAQERMKTVTLDLEEIPGSDNVRLEIVLRNPDEEAIVSAETWFAYNPDHLKGVAVKANESDFALIAPYSNDFDQEAGIVMLGRSSTEPVTSKRIVLGEIEFEKLTDGVAMIDAYDYKVDLAGHSSVNTMVEGDPINVLLKPESPLYIIQ